MTTSTNSSSTVTNNQPRATGFAILESGLRISYIIIKIVIAVFVPKGKHLYDLDMSF